MLRYFLLAILFPSFVFSKDVETKKVCFQMDVGGWAFNGHEQKEEYEKIKSALEKCKIQNTSELLYTDYRDSGAVFNLGKNAYFMLDDRQLGPELGIQHTQDWIQMFQGSCSKETVPRVLKPKGMKSPTAQVLKCSDQGFGWGRESKVLKVISR